MGIIWLVKHSEPIWLDFVFMNLHLGAGMRVKIKIKIRSEYTKRLDEPKSVGR